MRDEERGTRELPAGDGAAPGSWGPDRPGEVRGGRAAETPGDGAPAVFRQTAEGIDGIPEQARPHPEGDPAHGGDTAARGTPAAGRGAVGPAGRGTGARGRATGRTMSEHERNAEDDAPAAEAVRAVPHDPHDRTGARALFVELRGLDTGSTEYAELRNRLVRMHLPLVEHLARRFRNRGEPLDDLTQVATIGLIKSVDRFDPERGVEFSTYATPTVVGEIKRHFRDKGWAVRVPRRLQELRLALTTATAELSQLHGRSPTVHELAEKLAISEEEVLEGLESANAYSTLSLDVPDTDDESPAVADTLGAEDEALEGVEYRESLKPLLEDLPPREKRILLLRFFGNMTQSQIAQEVGISQMHVSRLLARTLAQLREKLLVEE
ncbi:RNA polymerase sigma factor SigF [Streptomyces pyxinicus]|uniref:RNA polymerase sigma factor SigF n=1 Tax=Streptomyces pyxinicus TaxID=2970331 RepID=UPI003D179E7F